MIGKYSQLSTWTNAREYGIFCIAVKLLGLHAQEIPGCMQRSS